MAMTSIRHITFIMIFLILTGRLDVCPFLPVVPLGERGALLMKKDSVVPVYQSFERCVLVSFCWMFEIQSIDPKKIF